LQVKSLLNNITKYRIPSLYALTIITIIIVRGGAAYFYPEIAGDTPVYKTVALNILNNNCISLSNPDTNECLPHWGGNQPPGYPFYISIIYYLFNRSDSAIAFVQVIIFILALSRLMFAIYHLTNRHSITLLIGFVIGLSPIHVFWTRMILSDPMALAATMWVFAELIFSIHNRNINIINLSASIVTAFFFRYDAILILIPTFGLCLYLYQFKQAMKKCILMLFIISIPIGLLLIRNYSSGLSLVRPFEFYEKDGTIGPLGYYTWVGTWVDRAGSEMDWIAPARMQEYNKLIIPNWAYKDNEELNKVSVLLDSLNKYQNKPIPASLDKEFELIAKERVKKYPFWHLIILPIKKAKSLWLWPFHSEAWPKAKISIIRNHYKSKNKSNILVKDMFRSLINDPITVISRIFLLSYKYLLFIIFIAVVLVKKKINNSSYNILYYVVVTNAVIKTIFYIQFHVLQSRLLISTFVGLEIVTIIYVYSYLEKMDLILKRD